MLAQQLYDTIHRVPDRECLVFGDQRVSYRQLGGLIATMAKHFSLLPRKSKVALLFDNSIEYVASYYAAWWCGHVVVALNAQLKAPELIHLIAHSDAEVCVASGQHKELEGVLAGLTDGCELWMIGSGRESVQPPHKVIAKLSASEAVAPENIAAPDELAVIIYTSGTTGSPKGVMLSHRNLAANVASIIEYLELTEADKTLCPLPFFYSYGNSLLHTHLAVGACLVCESNFLYPRLVLEKMVAEQVTGFSGVPSTYALLLNRTNLDEYSMPHLRYFTQAGGAMSVEHIQAIRLCWPAARMYVMYGQTEASARLSYLEPELLQSKCGSVGRGIPGVKIEVRDESGQVVKSGEVGEVCAAGSNIMLGYWKDPAATAAVIRDGWLYTGDMGYMDADDCLYLIGRNKEMIKSGGHRIAPAEIEELVNSINGVIETAAVSVSDDILGSAIKLFVVREDKSLLSARDIQKFCKQNMAQYKIPKVVEFVNALPKTASGKIKKHELNCEG